jgi:hypothetical protein
VQYSKNGLPQNWCCFGYYEWLLLFGAMRYGAIWCEMARYGAILIRRDMARYGARLNRRDMARYDINTFLDVSNDFKTFFYFFKF